jgi:carbonic anhydrase
VRKRDKHPGDVPFTYAPSRHTRRGFLRASVAVGVGGLIALTGSPLDGHRFASIASSAVAFAAEEPAGISADDALKMLMEGNARYVAAKPSYPGQSVERRVAVAKGQHPIAVILGCADSRVAPELLFDQGLGDLFVVRVAGNIADDAIIGSIEYALEHLGAPLVMVLGHERCGAVAAAVDLSETGGEAPGHLGALVKPINPAVVQAKTQGGDLVDMAVIANVGNGVAQLKMSEPVIMEMVHHEKVKVVGARYDLDTGEVTIVA